jgi:TonB family protein
MARAGLWWVVLVVCAPAFCPAATDVAALRVHASVVALEARENQIWVAPLQESKFTPVAHITATSHCEDTEPPEALATPNPLLETPELSVTVSFIVGTDGRVHSPFILESSGSPEDGRVLSTVRAWRYRPATCNGVPAEAEARIQFFRR